MLFIRGQVQGEDLGDEGTGLLHLGGVGGDADQGVGMGVELLLERDDHNIHLLSLRLNVRSNLESSKYVKIRV